ncbi:MAG: hypothetical protein UV64_C0003G0001 [Parcubacteria group bacterium GW2011_GWC1_43_11b]|uniref:Lipoprotein n=1 Tax=Candidatus Vogelbacteria bacterium RIFOXYB1_FULL_42_16 TaxID=1802436 RepID=A0A1G2QDF7_9BACT|nr:MAG: hypothetical protein UV50_C0003G0001 [Parcubacteria group bacterium GW2011_GWB1_42_9]KKS89603.1 MAG: hypothetical protein UV64_C0003G0001 [Parcubacteria group bacterium GW2011_GWC1_43_11b]KKT10054.1 MAG: hypothetical protein UV88_C0002G0001 [Parcubacteria group bacterium GW2011_GWA1_43_21]OHA58042.1 MAG: hypothetical protein A2370_01615 [Candidatus Vogelbacteria bacterium RIFOXYB1_FULL_42_16]
MKNIIFLMLTALLAVGCITAEKRSLRGVVVSKPIVIRDGEEVESAEKRKPAVSDQQKIEAREIVLKDILYLFVIK